MDHRRRTLLLPALFSLLLLMDGEKPAWAADPFSAETPPGVDGPVFNEVQSLSDEELDELRGGFVARNGMIIDFAFSTSTLVDGELIHHLVLNSADPGAINTDALHSIIQIGEGNAAFDNATDLTGLTNILNVVQNNIDDLTIQQVNLLNLSVENLDNFIQQSILPEIDFQSTMILPP